MRAARLRSLEGAATLEAVLALPVLILALVCTGFARDRYLARQRALLAARACAWRYAVDGCDPDHLPDSCDTAPKNEQAPEGRERSSGLIEAADAGGSRNAFDPLDEVPLLGTTLRAIFGATTTATERIDLRVPGGGGAVVSEGGEITVACNTRPREVKEILHDALRKVLP